MRLALALGVVVALAGAAAAQKKPSAADREKAARLYDEGQRHYNLGEYDQAIEKFRQSYYLSSEPLLLFNIGQALRLKGDCGQALHSYRAYLREKPSPDNEKQVDEAIAICEDKAAAEEERAAAEAEAEAAREEREERARPRRGRARGDGDDGDGGGSGGAIDGGARPRSRRHVFTSRAAVGPALASVGDVDTGVLPSGAFAVGVPFDAGRLSFDAGALVTYTRVPWDSDDSDASGAAGLTGLLANLGVTIPLGAGAVAARLDAGAGILVLSGVTPETNPFLNHGERATGALRMLHARLGVGLEVAISSAVSVVAQPVVSYSPATDLRDDISAITRLDLLVGAALRL